MLKGRKPNHVNLIVPQENCFYIANTKTKALCEVKLPGFTDQEWDSFMVPIEQVFFYHLNPDGYNVIEEINRDSYFQVIRYVYDATTPEYRRVVDGSIRTMSWKQIDALFKI